MKRDLDLARLILTTVEAAPDNGQPVRLELPGYDPDIIAGHVKLLGEAGFLDAKDFSSLSRINWEAFELTWAGHEFLDAVRSDTLWSTIKTTATSLSFEAIKTLAVESRKERDRKLKSPVDPFASAFTQK